MVSGGVSKMKLREIRIQNFKSIENATVENIGNIDIFSGRNNSGKTAILEALTTLLGCRVYPQVENASLPPKLFSGKKFEEKIMEITLVFELNKTERSNGIIKYYHGASPTRLNRLIETNFLQKVEYTFQSFKGTNAFGLFQIRITGTDSEFGVIAEREEENKFLVTNIHALLTSNGPLTSEGLTANRLTVILTQPGVVSRSHPWNYPFKLFQDLMQGMYSFSPFRTSQPIMEAKTTKNLANNGSNLVQRIYTMKQNEDENWRQLREFAKIALPDLGLLQSRSVGKDTVTVFRDKKWKFDIDIHDMGSGIEQLLMIACVLISKSQGSLILIETPEHHMHPGAQRTLLQFIRDNLKNNQILITTHSPIFLSQRDLAMHVVTKTNEGTKVKRIEELDDLSQALGELGSRNSDLLLADFVIFVEGPSDEKIIKTWAKTLKVNFDSRNIFCITIGGSRNFYYYANSDVLQRISLKSPIPHLFIIDKDEKSNRTIQKIQEQVKENIHILERREIENYLLLPKYILEIMRIKAKGNQGILEKLETVQPEDIKQLISSKMDELKNVVLIKRIREEIGGGTFLPDVVLGNLIAETKEVNLNALFDRMYTLDTLVDKIYKAVTKTVNDRCSKDRLKNIVKEQASTIKEIWTDGKDEDKKKIVPGEAVLKGVFENFGLKYDKMKDGERIAQKMKVDEIQPEIRSILEKLK